MESSVGQFVFLFMIVVSTTSLLVLKWPHDQIKACNTSKKKLIVISIDGFRWDFIHGRAQTPTFEVLKRKGVHADKGMNISFISNTLPNHFSLVTGLHPESHGMLDNSVYDKDWDSVYLPLYFYQFAYNDPRWFTGIEPIWVSNQIQRKDSKSGLLLWPSGESAMKGVTAHRVIPHTFQMDEMTEVNHAISWLTDDKDPINFLMMYFPEPDTTAHKYGPESEQVTRKIELIDETIRYLMNRLEDTGLAQTTDVIILGDHGFTSVSKDKIILLDNFLEREWYTVFSIMPASTISVFPREGYHEVVYTKLKQEAESSGLFEVYEAQNIPERFHLKNHKRIPPIIAMANMNYSFITTDEMDTFQHFQGNHGYDNANPMMRPIFIAFGPSFKVNVTLDYFRNVDVYPLMCHLLGIEPKPNNGSQQASLSVLREEKLCMSDLLQTDRDNPCVLRFTIVETIAILAVACFVITLLINRTVVIRLKTS